MLAYRDMDTFEAFLELSSSLCRSGDYGDKKKVKKHNEATKKIMILGQAMLQEPEKSREVFRQLLSYDNDMVKLLAASICLDGSLFTHDARIILTELSTSASDETIRFSAKMQLNK